MVEQPGRWAAMVQGGVTAGVTARWTARVTGGRLVAVGFASGSTCRSSPSEMLTSWELSSVAVTTGVQGLESMA